MSPYRPNPRPAPLAPSRPPWWRRFFLGARDAWRARQRAEEEDARRLAALRWAVDRAWGHWYARSSYSTPEALAARGVYLQLWASLLAEDAAHLAAKDGA